MTVINNLMKGFKFHITYVLGIFRAHELSFENDPVFKRCMEINGAIVDLNPLNELRTWLQNIIHFIGNLIHSYLNCVS